MLVLKKTLGKLDLGKSLSTTFRALSYYGKREDSKVALTSVNMGAKADTRYAINSLVLHSISIF